MALESFIQCAHECMLASLWVRKRGESVWTEAIYTCATNMPVSIAKDDFRLETELFQLHGPTVVESRLITIALFAHRWSVISLILPF